MAYDSAYLLALFNRKAGRPTSDAVTDASKYARLTEAQNAIVARMLVTCPTSLAPTISETMAPPMTTSDDNTFRFGTLAYPLGPLGHVRIYDSLSKMPHCHAYDCVRRRWYDENCSTCGNAWVQDKDYVLDATSIILPNNQTFGGTLYWYGALQPPDISATSQPSLLPESARELIVVEAVRQFAQEYLRSGALTDEFQNEFDKLWPSWCTVWRTQFRCGGALHGSSVVATVDTPDGNHTIYYRADPIQMVAVAVRPDGVVPGATFVFASSNPAIATITTTGLLTPITSGTVTISATTRGVTATVVLTITSVTVRLLEDNTIRLQEDGVVRLTE